MATFCEEVGLRSKKCILSSPPTSNNKYSFIEILQKWFIMTGSTVHNLGVVQLASQELALDTVPPTLL